MGYRNRAARARAVWAYMQGGTPSPGTQPLRTISANMYGQSSDGGAGRLTQAFRWYKPIGSGDVNELVLNLFNRHSGASAEVSSPIPFTAEIYLCYNNIAVPMKRDGQFPFTVPAGANDFLCDPILPAAFGVTKFPVADEIEVRGQVSRPVGTTGATFPSSQTIQRASDPRFDVRWLDSDGSVTGTANSITNLSTPGAVFTQSGGAVYQRASGYNPILLGRFVSGDPVTEFIGGDSIDVGLNMAAGAGSKIGFGRNALSTAAADGSNFKAYLSCAVGGSAVTLFTGANTMTHAYMKYCKHASGAHLTNSFGQTGTGVTAAAMLAQMREWWATLRANGIQKIIAVGAQTRGIYTQQAGEANWTTEAGQAIAAGWQAGGNVEQYYALLPAEIAAGRIDAFMNFQSWRGADPNKWKVDGTSGAGTTDSTHPSTWVHIAEAAELRALKASVYN